MEILGIIPARGGSKSVPRKNVRLLAGRPLIAYSIEAALASKFVTRLVVTTDDPEIAAVGSELGAEVPFLRPSHLALDHVTDLPVFQHCLDWLHYQAGYSSDLVVHLRPTAPCRTSQHIDSAIQIMLDTPETDSVRSVCPAGQHPLKMWRMEGGQLQPFIPKEVFGLAEAYNQPRQMLPTAFVQNGAVDVIRSRVIRDGNSMSGSCIRAFVMDELDSVNIDSMVDWHLAQVLINSRSVHCQEVSN